MERVFQRHGETEDHMKQSSLTVANFDRLAKAVMERHHVNYDEARKMLSNLRLGLIAGEHIRESAAHQAAVLTAINTGKRAFSGGVTLSLQPNVPLLLPWPGETTLQSAAERLGATVTNHVVDADHVITFDNANGNASGLRVVCDGWRGGIIPPGDDTTFCPGPDFALGGILASGIAVAQTFLTASGINNRESVAPRGFSLWRPDQSWLSHEAVGPSIEMLPAKLWLLGLGHLGQAYAWTIGLLGCPSKQTITLYLQDYDLSESANWSAGLLCEGTNIGDMKTRITSRWLEQRGFATRIIERPFNENTCCGTGEPRVAMCGFDNAESRRLLELAGYDLIVDAALGGDVNRFDRIVLRTFPDASDKASEIYKSASRESTPLAPELFDIEKESCGILFENLAGKAVSSSFVGATASAFAIAEVLKALHGGTRCGFINVHLRDLSEVAIALLDEQYQRRVAKNGFVNVG
jgi:hypothetical protein